jgi:hypothetical protein
MRNQEQWPERKLEESRRRSDRFQGSDQHSRGEERDDYRRRGGEDYQRYQDREVDERDYFSGGDRGSQRYGGEGGYGGRGQQMGRGGYGRFGGEGGWEGEGGSYRGEPQSSGHFGRDASRTMGEGYGQSGENQGSGRGGEQGSYSQGMYGSQGQYQGHHHDDDYMHWRNEQLGKLDEDYKTWQGERRKKFADEFDKWRSERSAKAGSQTGTESMNTKK